MNTLRDKFGKGTVETGYTLLAARGTASLQHQGFPKIRIDFRKA